MKRQKIAVRSFRTAALLAVNLFDRVRAASSMDLHVQPTFGGFVASDTAHLAFNATYRTEQQARTAAFLGMANRRKRA